MHKTDMILERLKSQPKPTVDHPDELTDLIMGNLPDLDVPKAKSARRVRLYVASAIAVAASVLLLLVFHFKTVTVEQPVAAVQPTEQPAPTPPTPKKKEETKKVATAQPVAVPKSQPKKRTKKSRPAVVPMPTAEQAPPSVAQTMSITTQNSAEQMMREYRELTASIRQRGEQVTHRVAMLQQQQDNEPQYIEL